TRRIVSWDHTVSTSTATSEVGPENGPLQHTATQQGFFEADNLLPGKRYQFRVHECDVLTCAPWSDTLTATTGASDSDRVTIWLDNDTSNMIGNAQVDANGAFTAPVTIPPNTV